MKTEITPADQAMLRHLRQCVDRLQDERYRTDARPRISQELALAIEELKAFVSELRKKGVNI